MLPDSLKTAYRLENCSSQINDQIQINKAHVLNKSSKFKKCSFIYFTLASHELSQASQVKTDL